MIEEKLEELLVDEELEEVLSDYTSNIIVYNDDQNTFEWVIESFVDVLKHSSTQAEQLAFLIHFKGKANVKSGSLDELRTFKDALVDRGLSAVIE
ncbi:MAG: ATP-dependent Clp protease adaptor ClpS [Saprospiraceae bacterium]|jgi:ATP-dependent Clp protease adaptor protein ClpS|nr:ATP-dependent Clp protease adaptor ClpS [Saprospiraceae bacterium]